MAGDVRHSFLATFTLLDRVEGAREHTERSPGYYRTLVVLATEARGREVLVW
jgi:hypothetical protein